MNAISGALPHRAPETRILGQEKAAIHPFVSLRAGHFAPGPPGPGFKSKSVVHDPTK
jgi:hypothetical protein